VGNDLDRVLSFIEGVNWQFAKTYAKTWPHEYTVRAWRPDLDAEFEFAVRYIRAQGVPEPFGNRTHIYLYLKGYKYWTMGRR